MNQVPIESGSSVERDLLPLVRPELLQRKAYAAASPDRSSIRLHANENPCSLEMETGQVSSTAAQDRASGETSPEHNPEQGEFTPERELNRYPSPHPEELVAAMASYYQVSSESVMPVRGSDDGIDLLIRVFCRAGVDRIAISSPAFGMYRSSAEIQGAEVIDIPLIEEGGQFSLDQTTLCDKTSQAKLVFICTPNNPSGHSVSASVIESMCVSLAGKSIVVVDEAYIEFSEHPSVASLLQRHSNLVILRTLSKAFAAAGLRCGAVLADPALVLILRSVASPYALAAPVVDMAVSAFESSALSRLGDRCRFLNAQRDALVSALGAYQCVLHVYHSDANFLLVRFKDVDTVLCAFEDANILVRNFSKSTGSLDCLRISIGTEDENRAVLAVLDQLQTNQETMK